MNEGVKIALGAFAGVIVGLLVQLWKSLRDERRILCDEFCKVALEAADAASEYWKGGSAASDLTAAKLIAYQRRLDGYRVLLMPAFSDTSASEVEAASVALYDALTGGEFRSATKPADERRAASAQVAASELVITIRRSFIHGVRLRTVAHQIIVKRPLVQLISLKDWSTEKGSVLRTKLALRRKL